jgi:hypothetical protein
MYALPICPSLNKTIYGIFEVLRTDNAPYNMKTIRRFTG